MVLKCQYVDKSLWDVITMKVLIQRWGGSGDSEGLPITHVMLMAQI